MQENANPNEPSRDAIDALEQPVLIEFGTAWCGHCQAALPLIAAALAKHPRVRHIKVEDGPGRRLGRSFGVKLWPTLIFLRRGVEHSIGIVTALNPYIGYANATEIAQQALITGESVADLVLAKKLLTREQLEAILRPEVLTRPHALGLGAAPAETQHLAVGRDETV